MNGEEDLNLHEEEEEEEEESNQGSDFSFLLEDEAPEETSAEKAAREEREESARQRAAAPPAPSLDQQTLDILADLKRNPEALRRVLTAAPPETVAPRTETAAPLDIEALTTELEQDFLVNPKKAFAKLIGIGQQYMAQQRQETQRTVAAAGLGVADSAIDTYMDRIRADKTLDPDVIGEMETMVAEARRTNPDGLARSTPAQIKQALEQAKATAVGQVYLRKGPPKPAVQRSVRPPAYASRGASGGGRTPSRDDLPKNEAERSLVMGLREGGCAPKEIVAALREFRTDQGGPRTSRRAG